MRWFWRRRHIEEALQAKRDAEQDRPHVEKIVNDLVQRKRFNNFAPMLEQAFQEKGG